MNFTRECLIHGVEVEGYVDDAGYEQIRCPEGHFCAEWACVMCDGQIKTRYAVAALRDDSDDAPSVEMLGRRNHGPHRVDHRLNNGRKHYAKGHGRDSISDKSGPSEPNVTHGCLAKIPFTMFLPGVH